MKAFICIIIGALLMIGSYELNKQAYEKGKQETARLTSIRLTQLYQQLYHRSKNYGSLHETPWSEFTIEEKMYLCAFGSSGNKFSQDDMGEIKEKYTGGK